MKGIRFKHYMVKKEIKKRNLSWMQTIWGVFPLHIIYTSVYDAIRHARRVLTSAAPQGDAQLSNPDIWEPTWSPQLRRSVRQRARGGEELGEAEALLLSAPPLKGPQTRTHYLR